ncbi:nitrogen metabolism transcriptional regulator NtrC [Moraxella macacae 0408225]|uniref:DNA-binding transcriptional regulator NtrC n=1 Tax=Moraxella macacae 0408225 TaxID=1230338 RepID=L2F669_9GAMM|nr:sigma 54-interacting transcriptional regulator [Moraxella macacae]ELA08405.1 nitrogen metabolism transcriptional regulator NtrC [Moraxella macacae 0408225]
MNNAKKIWVIDDDVALRMILQDALTDANFEVQTFGNAKLAYEQLENTQDFINLPQVILTDMRMPLMSGLDFGAKLGEKFAHIPLIVMTAHADVQSAVDSYQVGAFEYLPKPFDLDVMLTMVKKAGRFYQEQSLIKNQEKNQAKPNNYLNDTGLKHTQQNHEPISGIIGKSSKMQQVFRAIGRLASMPMTVLITGKSGTGKELVANALHEHSPRKTKPFIALNMSAIPQDLIESELFGHEKGAFTGAIHARLGRFEQAHGGTLFLDEIGDMPLSTQTRLLRVLANGEFFRVGGQKPIKVDVRILAATHQPLENLVKLGKFREDLFYRLNVIRLQLPTLQERREDIALLLDFFMQKLASQMQLPTKTLSSEALHCLTCYHWPGNVRELENVCRWLMVMTTGHVVKPDDLPVEILNFIQTNHLVNINNNPTSKVNNTSNINPVDTVNLTNLINHDLTNSQNKPNDNRVVNRVVNHVVNANTINANDWQNPLKNWLKLALEQDKQDILQQAMPMFEQILLTTALDFTNNHKSKAAQLLGWGRNTLTRKHRQLLKNQAVEKSSTVSSAVTIAKSSNEPTIN